LTRTEKARGGSKPIRMLIGNAIVTALLLVGMCLYGVKSGADARQSETADARLRELDGQIALYDEVLTMSALTGVATGDRQWEERYNRTAPKLDAAIGEVRGRTGCIDVADPIRATDVANVKLVGLETLAFRLARDGRRDTAMTLLLGGEYATLKRQYAAGMAGVTAEITKHVTAGSRRRAQSFAFGSLAMVLLLIAVWLGSFRVTRRFITEQRQAQSALRERVKELDCLFGMARLIEKPGIAVDELAQGVMNLLAGAMQYPEAAGARVRVGEKEYQTPNWDGTTLRIQEPIRLEGVETGAVELGYPPSAGKSSPSFVPEEHNLLSAVAERLGRILERMHTAAALIESEKRFRELFDSMSSGVAVYETRDQGVSFIFKDFSQGAERIESLRREEVVGRDVKQVFPGIEKFGLLAVLRRVWQTGEPERHPIGRYEDDRIAGWRENYVYRIPSGEVVAVYDDVTVRVQAEQALRESEERYRVAFESSAVGKIIAGLDGHMLRANQAFADMVGYTAEELQAGDYVRITHPDDVAMSRALLARLTTGTESCARIEKRYIHKDGSTVWADLSMVLLRDSRGQPLHFVLDLQNTTERKRAEATLRESEERFKGIFDAAQDGMVLVEVETGRFITANAAFCNMLGYGLDEVVRLSVPDIHPSDSLAYVSESFARQAAGKISLATDIPVKRSDGSVFYTDVNSAAVSMGGKNLMIGAFRDITERKQAEVAMRAVQARREQLENIVGRSPAVAFLWRTDEQLTVDFVSSNVSQFGYEPEEFLDGRLHYAAIVHPEDRDRAVADAARHVAAGTSEFVQEYRILTKTGEQRWVEDHTWVPRDSDGTITHHQGIIVDVTERKLAEAEVAQLSQRNQLILNAAGEGIIGLDSTGRCTFVNPAAIQMLGFDLNELVGHKLHALTHHTRANGEPYPPEECPIYRAFNDGLTHEAADELFWRKDGTSFPVEYSSTPVREGGRLAGAVVTFKDITERKQAEAALAESELTYRRVFESSNDAMMLLDSEKFLDCNDATLRVFGYSTRDEFLGKHPGQVSPPLQADGRESRVAADEKMVTAVRDGRNFFEWLHQRADGTVFPADVLLTPLDYHGRKVLQATVRDITPRKIAEVEIAQKNAELAKLNELKNQLLGMAAHDLRNPLTVVNTASSFLLDDASRLLSEEKKHDFMRRINANGEFMLRLIDNLLDVAKIESGRLDLELATGDLCGLIEENLTMNRMLAEKKSIRLDFAPERGVPLFRFDRGKVEQVLNNLISNALKFSEPDTVVTVQASRVNGTVVVSVRDHGQGIPAEELDKLFKPFSKTSVRGTAGEKSTGLGLAICRKIVEGHHGRIWAESEPGKGSTFSFALPAAGKEQS
jgi:PAS domain S-box-containing protein